MSVSQRSFPWVEASKPDRAVDAVLAEFNALRSEIVSHITAQAAVAGLGLTAMAVVIGFVAKEGSDDRLLLIIPPVTMLVVLLHAAETYRSAQIGTYIRVKLWPYLESQVGEIPSWEDEVARGRLGGGTLLRALFVDFPAMALFIVASIVALALVGDGEFAWWAGCGMTAIALAVPLVLGLDIRLKSRSVDDPDRGCEGDASRSPRT
jgi:hypothetical protein